MLYKCLEIYCFSFLIDTLQGIYINFTFKRQLQAYILTVFVPSLLLVIISWMSFWIDAHAAPARVSLGITTVMTSTTMTASMQETFPDATGAKVELQNITLKGVHHPQPEISMFCALSQNYQHLFEK